MLRRLRSLRIRRASGGRRSAAFTASSSPQPGRESVLVPPWASASFAADKPLRTVSRPNPLPSYPRVQEPSSLALLPSVGSHQGRWVLARGLRFDSKPSILDCPDSGEGVRATACGTGGDKLLGTLPRNENQACVDGKVPQEGNAKGKDQR